MKIASIIAVVGFYFDSYGVQAGNNIQFTIHRVGAEGPNALLSTLTTLTK